MKQVFAWGMIFVCALIFALLVDKGVSKAPIVIFENAPPITRRTVA